MLDDQVCPLIGKRLKKRRGAPSLRWHLDEMVCRIGGKRMYLWRAVDDEGEVLDLVVQRRRDTETAIKLLTRQLHNEPVEQTSITTHAAIYNTFKIQRHLISSPTLRRFRGEAATAWATAVL